MMKSPLIFFVFLCVVGFSTLEVQGAPPIKIVYFVPSDCKPFENREERLGRVMENVREFYRKGMKGNGYGDKTFALEWDSPGRLKLYTVCGKKRQAEYGRNDAGVVRNEVRESLLKQFGIEINEEVVVIFQVLLQWDGDKAKELGPFVGGGGSLSGTAWVYDDPRLDAANLSSKESGGYYNGKCSIGKFNTHYIGGVAHELGHAFSLPHECELSTEKKEWGASLMGGGNHTYGQELRNEGKGTFLSAASALRLSTVRAFVGDLPRARERVHWQIEALKATYSDKKLILEGRVSADPPLAGMIVYNDDLNIPADYDAKTWTLKFDEKNVDNRFRFEIDELRSVPYQLRLVGVHDNGKTNQIAIEYAVDEKGGPELSSFNSLIPLNELRKYFSMGNRERVGEIIDELQRKDPENAVLIRKAKHLQRLLETKGTVSVRQPESRKSLDLTFAEYEDAKTGWGNPRRGHVPGDILLQVGSEFFESGFYAHAPSTYRFKLDGRWKSFETGFGLQDGHGGSVVFVIRGDGKELFRSEKVADRKIRRQTVDVSGVDVLELIVEDAGNGNTDDWGVWIEPTLKR